MTSEIRGIFLFSNELLLAGRCALPLTLPCEDQRKNGHQAERIWESITRQQVVYSSLMASPHEVTRLMREWANGTLSALEVLTPLV
jgi:hypothetical protein